jgi:hypothetical protein
MYLPIHFGGVAMKFVKIISAVALFCEVLFGAKALAAETDYTVYQVYRPIDLGDGATPPKDIFVSWGPNNGVQGCLVMSNRWFNEYMFRLVVDKKYVPENLQKEFEQKPVMVMPEDPLFGEDD